MCLLLYVCYGNENEKKREKRNIIWLEWKLCKS